MDYGYVERYVETFVSTTITLEVESSFKQHWKGGRWTSSYYEQDLSFAVLTHLVTAVNSPPGKVIWGVNKVFSCRKENKVLEQKCMEMHDYLDAFKIYELNLS